MAYFANGSEERDWQAENCEDCHHDKNRDCPLWLEHLVNSYGAKEGGATRKMLDNLMPQDGCAMFVERETGEDDDGN